MADRKNSVGVYRVPLIVEEGTILPANTKKEDFAIWYIGGKKRLVYLVPASKEVYDTVVNPDERDKKQKQRQTKRAEEKGERFAAPLSYDALVEDYEYDAEDTSAVLDLALLRILFDDLVSIIEKKYPHYGPILRLTKEGKTQREIAEILGKSQSTIKEQQPAAIRLLRELYNS